MRTTTALDAAKVTTGIMDAARIGSGTLADARISQASVVQHSPPADLTAVRQDIAMLALYSASADNKAAYSLPYSFIDQFEDDTGVTTKTNVSNVSEYFGSVYTVSGQFANDANTVFLLHSDTTDGSTVFTDSSSSPLSIARNGAMAHSTTKAKLGASSLAFNGSCGLTITDVPVFGNSNNYTFEYWIWYTPAMTGGARVFGNPETGSNPQFYVRPKTAYGEGHFWMGWENAGPGSIGTTSPETQAISDWVHMAIVQEGDYIRSFAGGVNILSVSHAQSIKSTLSDWNIGSRWNNGTGSNEFLASGSYIDEVRLSNTARYSGTSSFTPQTDTVASSATGTLVSDVQTAPAATTKMSGVILYKDNVGSATTLGTHLKIYLTANLQGTTPNWTGTDWTEVVAGDFGVVTPLFSAGVKMVRLAEQTVVSGTACAMKAVWATQATGVRETQLHGWAMNY